MKNIILSLILGSALSVSAQEPVQINFRNDMTWQQVLDSAAKEKKLVFADIYTDWCVPCKRLEKEVFSLKSVAGVFNNRFINYRINAEKGEGIRLAKLYGVDGYPYLLFTDGTGTLVYSVLGYRSEREILKDADLAYQESNDPRPLGTWQKEYDSLKNDTSWLSGYIRKRNKMRMDNVQLLEDYYSLLSPSDYMKTSNLLIVIRSSGIRLNGNVFDILVKNFYSVSHAEDSAFYLQSSLLGVFENALNKRIVKAIEDKNEQILLDEVVPAYIRFPKTIESMPWYSAQDENMWKFTYYNQTNNSKKFIPVALLYLKKYYFNLTLSQIRESDSIIFIKSKMVYFKQGTDSASPMIKQYFSTYTTNDHLEKLVGAAYTVYNNSRSPADLKIALTWSERALQIRENLSTAEIYSRILFALKRKQEAVVFLQSISGRTADADEKEKLILLLENIKQNKLK